MAESTLNETLGFGLSAAVTYTAADMAKACYKRSRMMILVSKKLTEAAERFETEDFSSGLEKIQEASDFFNR